VAPAVGEECVIIDPGQDAQPGIEEILTRHRLKPIAVLLTHGHIDHVWSVAPVCGAKGIPAYIHPDDRELLSDPGKGLSLGANQQLFGGLTFSEPDDVKVLTDHMTITLAGVEFTVAHMPGHTEGSVTFGTSAAGEDTASENAASDHTAGENTASENKGAVAAGGVARAEAAGDSAPRTNILFSGDLLFAGSIGRTDLPGGDHQKILRSLERTLDLADDTVVLPGHGPQTTIGTERAHNPFLTGLKPAQKGM
jgi:glyoxylase-like metal-dependent hydrolase (beta-lactamase superfamily II)